MARSSRKDINPYRDIDAYQTRVKRQGLVRRNRLARRATAFFGGLYLMALGAHWTQAVFTAGQAYAAYRQQRQLAQAQAVLEAIEARPVRQDFARAALLDADIAADTPPFPSQQGGQARMQDTQLILALQSARQR